MKTQLANSLSEDRQGLADTLVSSSFLIVLMILYTSTT